MSLSVILIGVFIVIGIGIWMYFGGDSQTDAEAKAKSAPASFRCKVCGAKSPTFLAAHEHASAEHELAGHKIDESIESE